MTLPTYDKSKRRKDFQQLPKGAYVVKFMSAKEDKWPSGDPYIKIPFDIAEGEYKDFYAHQFEASKANNEDAVWPYDAVFNLNIPDDGSKEYVWKNWNSFFADLEDSNNGFVFAGDVKSLKGKIIGGKFRIKQTEKNGKVYDHTELRWTCVAADVRNGKAGNLPNDYLIEDQKKRSSAPVQRPDPDEFMNVPEGDEEEFPF